MTGENTLNYNEQGGATEVIGGTEKIVSGGVFNVESGGALQVQGTDVTAELLALDGTTATATEINKLAGVVAGTASASKAAVLGANKNLDTLVIADGGLFLGAGAGTAVGATAAEINQVADISAYQETISGAGALSITKRASLLALSGAGAVTLAAPDATNLGYVKVIEMTTDNGDVTLALTNVVGQSSGTTATFNDAGDQLVLIAGTSKWIVLKERGITLS